MQKRLLATAFIIMVCLLALPNIDYDSQFRLHIAQDYPYSTAYIHGVTFLPTYQFIATFLNGITALRVFSIICVLLSSIVFNKIMENFVDKKTAKKVAALFLFNPLVLLYGSLAMSESLAVLLMLTTLHFYFKDRYRLSAMTLTAGVLTSYWLWALTPFFLFKGLKNRKSKYLLYICPIFAIVAWGITNYTLEKSPLHFVDITRSIYANLAPKISLDIIQKTAMYGLVFPMAFTFGAFLFSFRNKISDKLQIICAYFAIFYTALLSLGTYFGFILPWARYFLPLIPTFLMLGAPAMLATRTKYRRLLIAIYFIVALIATVLESWQMATFQRMMGPQ